MKLIGKLGAIMLALTLILASTYIADAGMGGGMDRQMARAI